jgi:hypothetical protein
MKKQILQFTLICLISLVTFSCKKNKTEPIVENLPETTISSVDFQNFLKQNLESKKQKANFNAEDGFTFTSAKGVMLQLWPNSLTYNGQLVTGEVNLEYIEFFGRGAMAVSNVTTIGLDSLGEKGILTSGGTFHIKVYQNGNELASNSGMMLKVPTQLTGGPDSLMKPFEGSIDVDGNLIWVETNIELFINDGSYEMFLSNFGWFNVDRFILVADKKSIYLEVPQGYTASNTAIFVSISNIPNSLTHLATGVDWYPQGETVHLIFMSANDNQFLYAIRTFIVGEENNVVLTKDELQLTSEANLTQIVNNLP